MASSKSDSSLVKWVNDLFHKLFFQTDEAVAVSALEAGISKNFQCSINHGHYDYASFNAACGVARAQTSLSLQSQAELLTFSALASDEGSSEAIRGGSVAQKLSWVMKVTESGQEVKQDAVIIVVVKIEEGERKITEWYEVMVD